MPPDANPGLSRHPDVAGWVLSALDHDDALRFRQHLQSCERCRAAVEEFRPVARALAHPAPAAEPPADLGARTLAAVQQAAMAGQRPAETPAKQAKAKQAKRWHWHWNIRLVSVVSALGAAAVIIATAVVLPLLRTAPAEAATVIPFHSPTGGPASGRATIRRTAGAWSIYVIVHGLKDLGPGWFYECSYTRPGHYQLILVGTFTIGPSGSKSFAIRRTASPPMVKTMQITAERFNHGRQHGQVILIGRPRPHRQTTSSLAY
jgi:Anti-sigma-K factor rskA/Putative zinc-finger